MTASFLLDTSVLSETSRPSPRREIIRFLHTAGNLYISVASLFELQLGIVQLLSTNPTKAIRLSEWYSQLLKSGIPILPTTSAVTDIMASLSSDPLLRNLAVPRVDCKKIKGGQDLHIAAASLAHRLPIATLDTKDFLLINSVYPLIGVYNPLNEQWHARMEPLGYDCMASMPDMALDRQK
ncbi:PIN domain-containing protein [Rhizobium jaguaris]|uniref:Type II toxin-antitoxin system VapC family toxin n=1 Tax=Rhizobium jaguaris TaxID=1312183 RepID=A0A387FXZ5_9HYPH|nr:PIN domain-containing protein [Rhizobium jaguaris]AYG59996.1 type II toxin-antitoxin system VapC family toxin [Rhizobium jaguaris]